MLFLPKNTSIDQLIEYLLPFHEKLTAQDPGNFGFKRGNQLILEIEELFYGNQPKAILVSTGKLAKVSPIDIYYHLCKNYSYNIHQNKISSAIS